MPDPLVQRFVEAHDLVAAEAELQRLIEGHALPLAEAIVARSLRSFSNDAALDRRDRHDVVGDALATLIDRLWRLRDGDGEPISNFEAYAASVIRSACAHEIRRRHPERARLKNRLRYVLSSDSRLALWTSEGDLVCGRKEWRGRSSDRTAARRIADREIGEDWLAMERDRLARALHGTVDAAGGPIPFESLVAAASARMVEPREAVDPAFLAAEADCDLGDALDQRRFLAQIWEEVGKLPLRQRVALLLNLRDAKGCGLLWLLPIAGIATVVQIARILEIPREEFIRLWAHIPLDDAAIAARLACTRQQVINLRLSARKRLSNRVTSASKGVRGSA